MMSDMGGHQHPHILDLSLLGGRATIPDGPVPLARGLVLQKDPRRTQLMKELYRGQGVLYPQVQAYRAAGMTVIATVDETARFGALLHLSVSFAQRDPTWDELKLVKAAFFGPERDAMLILPREEDYVNVHAHCFHLQECPERWGMR